jgi:hypothetical protein
MSNDSKSERISEKTQPTKKTKHLMLRNWEEHYSLGIDVLTTIVMSDATFWDI